MKDFIDFTNLPKHIAIIIDGSGRWAQKKHISRLVGHHYALNNIIDILNSCIDLGVFYLTFYVFSKENWNRPKNEVFGLMYLFINTLKFELNKILKGNVKIIFIGDLKELSNICRREIFKASKLSKSNNKFNLIIAINYSGRWDIVSAVKSILKDLKSKNIKYKDINDLFFQNYLSTKDIPDPELLIRTSGEIRLSNFFLWQIAYTEIFISNLLWPYFKKKDFYNAIVNYQKRNRKFGSLI